MKKSARRLVLMASLLAGLQGLAAVSVQILDQPTVGAWTSSFTAAKKMADEQGIPLVLVASSSGCTYCNLFDSEVFKTEAFQNWCASKPYLFCKVTASLGNWTSGEKKAILDFVGSGGLPRFSVYWNRANYDGGETIGAKSLTFAGRGYSIAYYEEFVEKHVGTYADKKNTATYFDQSATFACSEADKAMTVTVHRVDDQDSRSVTLTVIDDLTKKVVSSTAVEFAAGETSASVELKIEEDLGIQPKIGLWTGDRSVTLSLEEEEGTIPDGGALTATATVTDADTKPVISFAAESADAKVPGEFQIKVVSSTPCAEAVAEAFRWRTVVPEGSAAKAGVDFVSVSDGVGALAAEAKEVSVTVTLCEAETWRPARTVEVQLETSGLFEVGSPAAFAINLPGDADGNADGATADKAHAVAVESTTKWATAEDRNLNHVTTEDWISFSPVAAGTYRIGADLTAPADAAAAVVANTTVTVVTNGEEWLSWTFSEVATDAPAITVTDELLKDGLKDGALLVKVTRPADDTARLEYSLKLRAWTPPVLTATVAAAEVDDTNAVVKVTLKRDGDATDYETRIAVRSQDGAAKAGRDYDAVYEVVAIPAGTNSVDFAVTLIPETNGVWRGDRTFALKFEAHGKDLYVTDGLAAKTVTLKEVDAEFETGDSAEESESAPAVTATYGDEALTFARTMHGSDANDYFTFSGVEAGSYYWLTAEADATRTVGVAKLKAVMTFPDGTKVESDFPVGKTKTLANASGEIKVAVVRVDEPTSPDSEANSPVSVGYTLTTGVWRAPRYQLSAEAVSVDDTSTSVKLKVLRLDNTDETSVVRLSTKDGTAKSGTTFPSASYVAQDELLTFEEGVSEIEQTITLLPDEGSVYTGDRKFSVELSKVLGAESVLGEPSVCEVTLKDADSELDEFDAADDDRGTTKNVFSMSRKATSAGEHRLNGGDLVDWYKIENVAAGRYYKFGLAGEPTLNNCAADEVNVSVYADGFSDEASPTASFTFADVADGAMVRLAEKTATDTDILVKVWRTAKDVPVSVAYELTFREQPPQTVTFATDRVVASELADAAYIDVVCGTDGGEALEEDVVATLTFADGTADASERAATAPADYDATAITVSWPAGTAGGTQRVRLPLANYGTDWKGDRGYTVTLNRDDDTDLAEDGIESATVWILEKDAPTYGTVAQTAVNGETLTKATTLAVREGDAMSVDVTLADGIAAAVTGEWTIVVGRAKTVVTQELFAAEEPAQTKTFSIDVPVTEGFQQSQSGTVTFAIKAAAKTVTLAKGAIASFKLAISDQDYAGAVGDVAKGDATQPAFRANAAAWFLDVDGAYRAAIPAAGGSVVLSTTVTGPGSLGFNAAIPEGCSLVVKATGSDTLTADEGENFFYVSSGTRTVTFTLTRERGAAVEANAVASVSDVVFTRSAAANAYGTFVGAVTGATGMEGLGTVTVAANGRMSGKFQFAGSTWTFSAAGGWDEGFMKTATAKCAGQSLDLALWADTASGLVTVGASYMGDSVWSAALYRNAWTDKPKTAAMAELSEAASGYYTATLADVNDTVGSGYLTLTIGDAGAVKAAGKLADGRSVSLSGTLTEGGVCLFTAPSAYRGGYFATMVSFEAEDGSLAGEGSWTSYAADSFDREVRFVGGWYDKAINLQDYYASGLSVGTVESVGAYLLRGAEYAATAWAASEEIPVSLAFAANGRVTATEGGEGVRDGRLFSMSFNRATGLFSGYLRAEYDVGGRTIRKSATYRGALTPVRPAAFSDDPEGRGFFLMNGTSYDFTIEEGN